MNAAADLAARFVAGRLPAADFDHRAHVAVALALLREHDFLTALTRFARGVRALAVSAGAADKFNLTMTVAWMSLIAERLAARPCDDVDGLLQAYPELRDTQRLTRLYGNERLSSALARTTFLLPDPPP